MEPDAQSVHPNLFCSIDSLIENERTGILGSIENIASVTVSREARSLCIGYLLDIHTYFRTRLESFFAAANIVDAYLCRVETVTQLNIQLVGIAAFSLAAKYHELDPPLPQDYVELTMNKHTLDEIQVIEKDIFNILGCNINVPCDLEYIRAVSTVNEVNKDKRKAFEYLLVITTIHGASFFPSVVTSSIVKLGCIVKGVEFVNHFNIPDIILDSCIYYFSEIFNETDAVISKVYNSMTPSNKKDIFLTTFNIMRSMDIVKPPLDKMSGTRDYRTYYRAPNFVSDLALDLLPPAVIPIRAQKLGEGTYGVVKRVYYKGKEYAVKQVKNIIVNEGVLVPSVLREISILLSLNHPNIVEIKHITSDFKCIFLDLGFGDLKAWTVTHRSISLRDQVDLASQLINAVTYIHSVGCLHRDIKPQNIIVYAVGRKVTFKLSDFGSSRGCEIALRDNKFTQEICTLWYRSPEILLGSEKYNDRLDVWSLLCTLYECATGKPLFPGDSKIGQLMKIFAGLGMPRESTNGQIWKGVSNLPNWDPLWPKFLGTVGLFDDDDMLSDCYKSLFTQGFILDPHMRPSSKTLQNIVISYVR